LFFDAAKDENLSVSGSTIKIKKGVSKFNKSRTWALLKGRDVVAASDGGASATVDMKERCVKVGTDVVFQQGKDECRGSFCGAFAHLTLPA
jgi:hypothetical protein